ncbi:hypothetical protein CYMTET_41063 [Cymbomonas tetramitiformis]|uniref:Uncharacterized protein n=1 Tax=Cymbomonas tetramitiformis TaxID=36881 RepID=A0AAE0C8V2_9CHLO|nr:hypothetical protein CYMTET_41063 [Cymbomonas tetramitiformis]
MKDTIVTNLFHLKGVNGTIPTEIGLLTRLTLLVIAQTTHITGPIPTEIGSLTQLTQMDLSANSLTGIIPTEFGALDALQSLRIDGNSFTFTIPLERMASMDSLTRLAVHMHAAIVYVEETVDWMQDEKSPTNFEELGERVYAAHNTFKGALHTKLAFVDEKVYADIEAVLCLVPDSVLTKSVEWSEDKEFDTTQAVMNTHAKASAKILTFCNRKGGKGKGSVSSGAGSEAGANSEVMHWISKAARMRWINKSLLFNYSVSLADVTPWQLEC